MLFIKLIFILNNLSKISTTSSKKTRTEKQQRKKLIPQRRI